MPKTVVDIEFRGMFKDLLQDADKTFSEIESMAKSSGVSKAMRKDIDDLKKQMAEVGQALDKGLNAGSVSTKALDAFQKDINNRVQKLEEKTANLGNTVKDLQTTMNGFKSSVIGAEITKLKNQVEDLGQVINTTTEALVNISKEASKRGSKVELVDTSKQEDIKKTIKILEDLYEARKELYKQATGDKSIDKSSTGLNLDSASVNDITKQFLNLTKALKDGQQELNKMKFSDLTGGKSEDSIMAIGDMTDALSDLAYITNNFYEQIDKGGAQRELNEYFDSIKNIYKDFYKEINRLQSEGANSLEATQSVDKKSVKKAADEVSKNIDAITVPIRISKTGVPLKTQALNIIKEVNGALALNPLEATFVLTSKYKTKKREEVLQQLEQGFKDQLDPKQLDKLIANVNKQFSEDISLNFKHNLNDDLVKDVQHRIKEIEREIRKAKISITPSIEITPEEVAKVEERWAKIVQDNPLKISMDGTQKDVDKTIDQVAKKENTVIKALNTAIANIKKELKSVSGTFNKNFAPEIATNAESTLRIIGNALVDVLEKVKKFNSGVSQMKPIKLENSIDLESFNQLSKIFDGVFDIKLGDESLKPLQDQFIAIANDMRKMLSVSAIDDWAIHFESRIKEVSNALNELQKKKRSKNDSMSNLGLSQEDVDKLLNTIKELSNAVNSIDSDKKISADIDTSSIDELIKRLEAMQKKLKSISTSLNTFVKNVNNAGDAVKKTADIIKEESEQLEKLLDIIKPLSDIKIGDVFGFTDKLKSFEEIKFDNIEKVFSSISGGLQNLAVVIDFIDSAKLSDVANSIDKISKTKNVNIGNLGKVSVKKEVDNNKQSNSGVDTLLKKIRDQQSSIENFTTANEKKERNISGYKEKAREIDSYIKKLEELENEIKGLSSVDGDKLNKLNDKFDELVAGIKKAKAEAAGASDTMQNFIKSSDITKEMNKLATFMQKNSGASDANLNKLRSYYNLLESMSNSNGKYTKATFDSITSSIEKLEAEMKQAGDTGKSMWDKIKMSAKSQLAQQVAMYFSFQDIIRYIRSGVQEVTAMDTALTELRKVSDVAGTRLSQSFEQSTKTAKELGATITNVISSTSDWARMGYGIDQAEELARVTTLYQNVGDNIDQQTASESLISTLQGFQLTADKGEEIIDKFNEVANNYAIDTKGIGEALQRSAASFNAAHTDLSKSVALITTANTVIQDPDSVGTVFKTLSARLRGAKTELAELGEETDYTTSKLRNMVKQMTGFDIMDDQNNFKDIYDIMLGIGEKWSELSDVERASLGEQLAGKRNANALYAVLDNLETLKGAYETAENSAGSAAREQENYEKSIQYSFDRMTASAQEFAASFLNSDFIKGLADIGNKLIGIAKGFTDFAGSFGTVALAAAPFINSKFGGLLSYDKSSNPNERHIGNINIENILPLHPIQNFKDGWIGLTKQMKKDLSIFESVKSSINNGADWGTVLQTQLGGASEGMKMYVEEAQRVAISSGDAQQGISVLEAGMQSLQKQTKLSTRLLSGLTSILSMGLTFGIVFGLEKVIGALSDLSHAAEKAEEETKNFQQAYNNSQSTYSNSANKISKLKNEYEQLAKGVSSSGENISLSSEQYDRYKNVVSEISDAIPTLSARFNENGEAIGFNDGKLVDLNKNLREYKQHLAEIDLYGENYDQDNLTSIIDNYANKMFFGGNKSTLDTWLSNFFNWDNILAQLSMGGIATRTSRTDREIYEDLKKIQQKGDYHGAISGFGDSNLDNAYELWIMEQLGIDKDAQNGVDTDNNKVMKRVNALLKQYEAKLNNSSKALGNGVKDYLETLGLINDENEKIYDSIFGDMSFEDANKVFGSDTSTQHIQDVANDYAEILESHRDDIEFAYNQLFKLDIKDMPIEEAKKVIEKYAQELASYFGLPADFFIKKAQGDFSKDILPNYERAASIWGKSRSGVDSSNFDKLPTSVQQGIYNASTGYTSAEDAAKNAMTQYGVNTKQELDYWIEAENEAISKGKDLNAVIEIYKQKMAGARAQTVDFKTAWDEISDNDAKDKLLDLAKAGKLTKEAFENSSIAGDIMHQTGLEAKEATIYVNNLVDEVQRMASMSGHINTLTNATQEKKDRSDHIVSPETLKGIEDDFGIDKWDKKGKKVWEQYKKVALDATASTKKMKQAQDELGTTFLNNAGYLQNLTNNTDKATKKQYEAQLKAMGVTNAHSVVEKQAAYNSHELAKAKLDTAQANDILAAGTEDEINALSKELDATGDTTDGILAYIDTLIRAGKFSLNTSGSIENLKALMSQLGIAGNDILEFINLMGQVNGTKVKTIQTGNTVEVVSNSGKVTQENGQSYYMPSSDAQARMNNAKGHGRKKKEYEEPTQGQYKFGRGASSGDGGGNSSSGGPSKSSQKDQKQYIDWIERRITRINNIIGGISAKIENIGKWIPKIAKKDKDFKWIKELKGLTGDARQTKIVQLTNAELTKEIKYYQTLYRMQGEAAREYTKKANKVGKKLPKSVKTKIKSGKYTNKDLKYWFNEYGQEGYDKIQKYIEYYDKAQTAKQGKQEAIQSVREAKIQKNQNYVDLYDKRKSRDEAQEAIAIGYKKQNNQVEEQLENLKQSYKYQEKIAKLNGDTAELERLKAEYEQERRELLYHEIENIKNDFERLRGINNRRIQDAENLLSVAQAEGRRVNTGWYTSKNINEKANYAEYAKEREAILKKLDGLKEGTTQWNDAMEDLQATENGMAESQKNIAENTKAIRDEIHNANAELREANTRRYDEAKFFANLSFEDTINSSGVQSGSYYGFTDTGRAKLGAGQIGLSVAAANIESTKKEMDEVRSIYSAVKDMSEEDAKKYFEAHDANFTSIKDAYDWMIAREQDYRNALQAEHDVWADLRSIMQEYYEGQKTYLGEMIEARKKILQEEKDMYDYEKSINEKTKNISTLQKRLAAIQGDNSEAGKARRQQIQTQLDQAQQDLQDTQYERWKSDQEAMLDNLQNQYDDIVDKHLKDVEGLEKDIKESIDNSASTASSYYEKFGDSVSSELSDLTGALKSGGNIDQKLQSILSNQNTLINKWINEQPDNQKNAEASPDKDKDDPNPSGNESQIADATEKITSKVVSETSGSLVGNITKSQLTKMVKDAGGNKGKDGKDYTALNSLLYKKTGYILSDHNALKKFYKLVFGSTKGFDDKFGKDGVLYKALKQAGFKSGGIGRLVKASGEDGIAMVRNGEGFVAPESVNAVQQWMNTAPDMTAMMNMINKNGGVGGTTNIGEMNFELPNVTDARSLIETFQNSKDMQRLLKIGVEDLMGQGKFSNKIFTV